MTRRQSLCHIDLRVDVDVFIAGPMEGITGHVFRRVHAECFAAAMGSNRLDSKCVQNTPCVGIDQDTAIGDFCRSDCLTKIDARVRSALVFGGYLPKRVLDDDGRVAAYAKLKKQNAHIAVAAQKILVAIGRSIPASILHERIVGAQVHRKWGAAVGATGHEYRRDAQVLLGGDHVSHEFFVVPGFLTAGLTALE